MLDWQENADQHWEMDESVAPCLTLRIAGVGGFGHGVCVFREMESFPEASVRVEWVGMAPAYEGESIDGFSSDPWVRRFNAPLFPDLGSMLANTRPDVLIVSTRPDQIPVAARKGLEAGCHLIVEKPVGLDVDTVSDLESLAIRNGLRVIGQLSMRTLPAFHRARERVQDGQLGKILLVNTRKSYQWGTRPDWFNDRSLYGGTWPWIGIHNLDMAHFVTGLPPVSVRAFHANLSHPDVPGCEDVAGGTFVLGNNALMTASIDLCRPATAPTWGDDWIRVVGSLGVIEANGSTGQVRFLSGTNAPQEETHGTDPLPIYLPFLRSLDLPDPVSDSLVFALTRAALLARDSADTGKEMKVPTCHA